MFHVIGILTRITLIYRLFLGELTALQFWVLPSFPERGKTLLFLCSLVFLGSLVLFFTDILYFIATFLSVSYFYWFSSWDFVSIIIKLICIHWVLTTGHADLCMFIFNGSLQNSLSSNNLQLILCGWRLWVSLRSPILGLADLPARSHPGYLVGLTLATLWLQGWSSVNYSLVLTTCKPGHASSTCQPTTLTRTPLAGTCKKQGLLTGSPLHVSLVSGHPSVDTWVCLLF